ncbi:uncharacterized protein TNCV_4905241 [Trichonephila clavipes]|uniref:DUF4817 domain-containing protein n=1 Tax=Trichonephila clavipes TaxID=2585209 RepID=A0A8X6V3G9_TRICX|nr:uncharacterized protein TNCV_4905241 [Trichonephila clavipes]
MILTASDPGKRNSSWIHQQHTRSTTGTLAPGAPTAARRCFQTRFNVSKGPDAKTIRTLFAKFQRTGSVTDDLVGNVGCKQTAVTPQNVATVSRIIQQSPTSSVRRTASEVGLKRSITEKIMRKSLHMFPFKIQTHHTVPVRAVKKGIA